MKRARSTCAAGTLRRASRSIARLYDSHLAQARLTTTQFSILSALHRHGEPVRLTRLAEELVFERTSLYRALEPLRRDALIAFTPGLDRRVKEVGLTRRGQLRIAQAFPHWQAAQDVFLERFGRSPWNSLAAQLGEIVAFARANPGAGR